MAGNSTDTIDPQAFSRKRTIGAKLAREARFFWNLVNPLQGRATVLISRESGEILVKKDPRARSA
jgi:hypothetical protein